jgi:hypothetical protein
VVQGLHLRNAAIANEVRRRVVENVQQQVLAVARARRDIIQQQAAQIAQRTILARARQQASALQSVRV